jgi:hypothetical protein
MGQNVVRHSLTEQITAKTRSSEVNASEYAGIINFRKHRRETCKRASTWSDLGRERDGCFITEGGC